MDRREFLKVVAAGACAAVLQQWRTQYALAKQASTLLSPNAGAVGSTVAIKRFARQKDAPKAVLSALDMIGGIDRVVKPGDTVVIKPNLGIANQGKWSGRTTDTRVMEGVVRAVVDAGGKPIVAEGTCEEAFATTTGFAEKVGLLEVCRKYGAKFVDLNNDEVQVVKVPSPLLWSEFHLARQALECDKFISVPVMKVHRTVGVTLGMKNLVGVTSPKYYGQMWQKFVRNKLHGMEEQQWKQRYGSRLSSESEVQRYFPTAATVADLASARKIDLVVVDGIFGEERNGPFGEFVDIKERSGSYLILAGTDTVAVDSIGAHIMRQRPERTPQFRFAQAKGLGSRNIDSINVVGERLEDVAVPLEGYIVGSMW